MTTRWLGVMGESDARTKQRAAQHGQTARASDAKADVNATIGLLAPGAVAVLDDFWFDPDLADSRRDARLHHPLLTTIELWVTRERRALVSVRR